MPQFIRRTTWKITRSGRKLHGFNGCGATQGALTTDFTVCEHCIQDDRLYCNPDQMQAIRAGA